METISIRYYRKKHFHLKLTNCQPRITCLTASQVNILYTGYHNKDIKFGNIIYIEPMTIEYKKLVNGVIERFKVSLIDGDGNEISSNFKISIVLHIIYFFLRYMYISWK